MPGGCFSSIKICRTRITRLGCDGCVEAGPNNSYVSPHVISVNIEPEYEDGDEITVKNGCLCVCNTFKAPDAFKRFNIDIENCKIELAMLEMLAGHGALTDAGGNFIGSCWLDDTESCDAEICRDVAIEFWTNLWDGDSQAVGPNGEQYIRWVFPRATFTLNDFELSGENFVTPSLSGTTSSNDCWITDADGQNPYADHPADVATEFTGTGCGLFYWIYEADIPGDPDCDYQTVPGT